MFKSLNGKSDIFSRMKVNYIRVSMTLILLCSSLLFSWAPAKVQDLLGIAERSGKIMEVVNITAGDGESLLMCLIC